MSTELVERLRAVCNGHPHAKIAWPHRILHEAADELTALTARAQDAEAAMQTYFEQLLPEHNAKVEAQRANTALTAKVAQLTEALRVERSYVEQAVKDDGGIDNCEIGDRLALERIDAALSEPDKEGT